MKLIDFSDDDELYLFERVVKNLQSFYGHSESDAIRMVNEYYHKFTNAEFCHRYNIPVQTVDFFFHIEESGMADRVHYYQALDHEPNEAQFIEWERKIRL